MGMIRSTIARSARRIRHGVSLIPKAGLAVQALASNLSATRHRPSLVILDDAFPNLLSAYRIAEFNDYLNHYPDARIYSTRCILWTGQCQSKMATAAEYRRRFPQFSDRFAWFLPKSWYAKMATAAEYRRRFPQFSDRFAWFHPLRDLDPLLYYCLFLNNAYYFIDYIERHRTPFVFTLYPGGGFWLNNPVSDRKLRRVCDSPCLQHVICTQSITHRYLLENGYCDESQTTLIYGAPPSDRLICDEPSRKTKDNKFNICFVSHKYMNMGIDKGYDIFIAVAHRLRAARDDIWFHVVGNWDDSDVDVSEIADRIRFHGIKPTDFFPGFYAQMDAIVSPNRPFQLESGAFDGFPTCCCIEAAMCGVAVFCTDPLSLNVAFRDGEELVLIPHDPERIAAILLEYLNNPGRLYSLGQRGQALSRQVFDLERQMAPRRAILEATIGKIIGRG